MQAVWTIQWDDLTIRSYEEDSRYIRIEARTADGQLVWEYLEDATGGERDLLPRTWICQEPSIAAPFLEIAIDAEHCKSGNGSMETWLRLDKQGKLIK